MKIVLYLIALLVLFCCPAHAQSNYSIKGLAIDTAEKKNLLHTTIMVLNARDSILRKFTRAKTDGSFTVNNLVAGKFILVLSYPGYADYSENFTLDDKNQQHDFGSIQMTLTTHLLQDVIIKAKVAPIKIKGDTTEFNARAYVIQPNDKVEDLIKQFPGIRVDRFGQITAQGQRVGKVLLDGEEFFGDDPTLVTKNIRADMVDKVQLYDKKSDQAAFTGIDDGKTTKTLNIKLKEDKKSGSFGKVNGGLGNNDYYTGQLMYNKFKDKEKIAIYGIGSNTGTTGLNEDDTEKFAESETAQVTDDGGIYFNTGTNDMEYNGRGLPKALAAGAHYDNKWDNKKYAVNGNYKIGGLNIDGTQTTVTQNNLPGRVINSTSEQLDHNSTFHQKLDATVTMAIDTTSDIKIALDGIYKNNKINTTTADTSRRGDNTLLNLNNTSNINTVDDHKFNASVFYTKKLKKNRRTISVLISGSADDNTGFGFLKSNLNYFDNAGDLNTAEQIDQQKTKDNKLRRLVTNITYTEPISKALAVVFNYGFKIDHSSSDQRSYGRPISDGHYTVQIDSLSNFFKLNQFSNRAGAIFYYNKGKTRADLGTRFSDVSFSQINIFTGNQLKRTFINWSPQANLTYDFTSRQYILLAFGGKTIQPNINQIQPVRDNTNPLYVTLGNPNLTPSFLNYVGLIYNSFQIIGEQSIRISAKYNFTNNPIVSNISTDSIGKTTVQYFNLSNRSPHNWKINAEYFRQIPVADITGGLDFNLNSGTSYNMVKNGVTNITELNTTNNIIYGANLYLRKSVQNKFDASVSFGPQYIINQSSLQTLYNSNGGGFNGDGALSLYLPHDFQLSSTVNYTYTAKTQALPEGFRRTLWNASISKSFLKEKSLAVTGAINDILNQNKGFTRNAAGGIISEERYSTIKRYFMLSISYDFSRMGKGGTK
ncbi:Outer membrane receptor proteins, mostly Fe transport [Mucilaginibacter pineti]|uniref:Outer membrane receptor proteins, mostly Fe transport n=1 Tax=Mucilaginibacter pineti TaxID=1391627 RepID=A0A1G7NG09_9SPHI|nr:outer membrane beta-barrel protein [Mucilaginibacter pineti]SDF72210.1 Outer membrane receptor proteins, mostly Fe transport [Mucilaginibacter pineti]